jgi:hypothetical protein
MRKKDKNEQNSTCTVLFSILKLLASRVDWTQLQLLPKKKTYSYSSSQCCIFKIVCGILEFLDRKRETVTAFDVIHRFILLFAWDMPGIGFVGTAFS